MNAIDCHTHIFSPDFIAQRQAHRQRDKWFNLLYANPRSLLVDASALVTSMDEANIGASVAFGFGFADPGLCRVCNDYVLAAAAEHPGRILPFAVVNPASGDEATREARRCLEAGALGLGELMPDGQGFDPTDQDVMDDMMAIARAYDVPVMIHVNELVGHHYAGKGSHGPRAAYETALHYPENTLIYPHWGGGLPFYELMPEVHRALGHVYYDTAASLFLYDDSIFGHVMDWIPDRVLFGTDYPLIEQKRFMRHAQTDMDPEAWQRFIRGNALALWQSHDLEDALPTQEGQEHG